MGEALKLSAWPGIEFDQWSPVAVMAAIEAHDLGSADENACLGIAVASARLVRRLQAIQAGALARACELAEAGRSPAGPSGRTYEIIDGVDLVAAEAGLALTLGKGEANGLVQDAVQVTSDLPRLAALALEGRLDWALAAKTHDRMTRDLQPGTPAWRYAETLLAERLPGKTWDAARAATWRILHRLTPRAVAEERIRKARQECFLRVSPLPDGMARIDGRIRADDARLINLNLDANADAARDHARADGHLDERTHQQRRAAYFVSIFRSIHAGARLPYTQAPSEPGAGAFPFEGTPLPSGHPFRTQPGEPGLAGGAHGNHAGTTSTASPADRTDRAPEQTEQTEQTERQNGDGQVTHTNPPGQPQAGARNRFQGVVAWWKPPPPATRHGRHAQLNLTMSLEALLDITDEPGHLHGHGNIPADLAREIARQAKKITLLLVPRRTGQAGEGQANEHTTHGPGDQKHCTDTARPYKPRPSVVDQVLGRFPTCAHPGCTADAVTCDLDHVTPYAKGGPTCQCNLVPRCRLHHRIKTHGHWSTRLTRPDEPYPPGSIEYVSRLGQRHIQLPPPLPGAPDPEDSFSPAERSRHRNNTWQSELRRVDPATRRPSEPDWRTEPNPGEPPF